MLHGEILTWKLVNKAKLPLSQEDTGEQGTGSEAQNRKINGELF